jgi:hypothetical protein
MFSFAAEYASLPSAIESSAVCSPKAETCHSLLIVAMSTRTILTHMMLALWPREFRCILAKIKINRMNSYAVHAFL